MERLTTPAKKQRIIELLRRDSYNISEITAMAEIDRSTYYEWIKNDAEFAASVEQAKEEFRAEMTAEAKKSLRRLICGYMAEETTTITVPSGTHDENGKPIPAIKEMKTVKKPIPPNTGAVIFTLTNVDPDNWKNRQEVTGNGKISHEFSAKDIPDDVLREMTDRMQAAESARERERRGL